MWKPGVVLLVASACMSACGGESGGTQKLVGQELATLTRAEGCADLKSMLRQQALDRMNALLDANLAVALKRRTGQCPPPHHDG